MTYDEAQERLEALLAYNRRHIERVQPHLAGFEEHRLAAHLLNFRNCSKPSQGDVYRLLDLLSAEGCKFEEWACPTCGTQVYGVTMDDWRWRHFQGVHGTQDFSSYPGRGPGDRRCDACRCHMVGG